MTKAKEAHLDEARIHQFAETAISFNNDENSHFERCSECRIKTTQFIRIQFLIDTSNKLQPADKGLAM